ncbi:ethanolamine ammonia-lyase subunit EutC [Acidisphaera sp. L21]|uniref:ethanolamine ammonia-lyase subunit EutC n=1 Tax=Acidisphaera sp. L21 TaxID=1641851 RepID=UPI00131D28C8|nr:ethanolamine ammonia-lyase subunit EutC [Acidisphaera sp. L21]
MTVPADDPWGRLRPLTAARIGLHTTGGSLGTAPLLALRLAHARARDAVHAALDTEALAGAIGEMLVVDTAAPDRATFLLRPDLGRQLAPGTTLPRGEHDLAIVLADGLSARAVQDHAPPVLAALLAHLPRWRLAPVVVVRQGRVAVGDAIANALGASAVLVLIGERPGLSAPDSLGAYLTWQPGMGTTDADRNCVSNIRPAGLAPDDAAAKIAWLLDSMRARGQSGVALKDDAPERATRLQGTAP